MREDAMPYGGAAGVRACGRAIVNCCNVADKEFGAARVQFAELGPDKKTKPSEPNDRVPPPRREAREMAPTKQTFENAEIRRRHDALHRCHNPNAFSSKTFNFVLLALGGHIAANNWALGRREERRY